MRNRVVKTSAKYLDQAALNQHMIEAGWEGLKDKEIVFYFD